MKSEKYNNAIFNHPIEIEVDYNEDQQEYIVLCDYLDEYGESMTELLAKRDLVESLVCTYKVLSKSDDRILGQMMKEYKRRFLEVINAKACM